jgi:hypothetical protein
MQVRRNLHVVFSFSPVGDGFRERLSRFPSLVNCTTIDWFTAWPRDALASVATSFLSGLSGATEKVRGRMLSVTMPQAGSPILPCMQRGALSACVCMRIARLQQVQ